MTEERDDTPNIFERTGAFVVGTIIGLAAILMFADLIYRNEAVGKLLLVGFLCCHIISVISICFVWVRSERFFGPGNPLSPSWWTTNWHVTLAVIVFSLSSISLAEILWWPGPILKFVPGLTALASGLLALVEIVVPVVLYSTNWRALKSAKMASRGDFRGALEVLNPILAREDVEPINLLFAARCHFALGEIDDGNRYIERVAAMPERPAAVTNDLADAYMRQGRFREALAFLSAANAEDWSLWKKCNCLKEMNEMDEARQTWHLFGLTATPKQLDWLRQNSEARQIIELLEGPFNGSLGSSTGTAAPQQ